MNNECHSSKDKYRVLCDAESSIPLFSKAWWLDAVCGDDGWNVVLVEKGENIIGAMPFYIKHHLGFKKFIQPPLTQTLGPWIRPSNAKYAKILSYQKSVLGELIKVY